MVREAYHHHALPGIAFRPETYASTDSIFCHYRLLPRAFLFCHIDKRIYAFRRKYNSCRTMLLDMNGSLLATMQNSCKTGPVANGVSSNIPFAPPNVAGTSLAFRGDTRDRT
mmetsp:Transcript_24077/g.36571  ORF Transcript_24077/g.36571 Transcript_24077/m.36571 type:complete len:112 (+) Transcript_24077:360-695(+)